MFVRNILKGEWTGHSDSMLKCHGGHVADDISCFVYRF